MLIIILVGFALRLFQLDRQGLWFDDIITVRLAQLPLIAGLDGLLLQGIQLTPFFHWVTKVWLLLDSSAWVLRFPALCFSLLALPLLFKLGQTLIDTQTGLLAAAVFTLNPFQIWYAQEVKVYSALVVAASGAMLSFVWLLRKPSRSAFWGLVAFSMLGLASHYFMLLVAVVQFIFIVIYFKQYHQGLLIWMMAQFLSSLILAPWLAYIVYRQYMAIGIGWVPKPRLYEPLLSLWNFTIGYRQDVFHGYDTWLLIFALGVVCICLGRVLKQALKLRIYKGSESNSGHLLLLWLGLPFPLVMLFSYGSISFYVDRYFLEVTPALTLLLAWGVTSLQPQAWRIGFASSLLVATSYGAAQVHFNHAYFTRDDWRGMAAHLRQQSLPGDSLVTCTDGFRLALNYYDPGPVFTDQSYDLSLKEASLEERSRQIPDFNRLLKPYKRLWLVLFNPRQPQHHLGYAYNLNLDTSHLSPLSQIWIETHLLEQVSLHGVTAYLFALSDDPDLNEIIPRACER